MIPVNKSVRLIIMFIGCCYLLLCQVFSQEMQPRAYLPAPIGVGFTGIGYSYNTGDLLFDPSLPIEDAYVKAHIPSLSVGASLGIFGHSSQALAVIPYAMADLTGRVEGADEYRYRSGLGDMTLRYSLNLAGAPAMTRKEFATYRQRTIVGVSLTATAPTGQYDPNVLINVGSNRWSFKPEVGISRAQGNWKIEGAFGVWLYTANPNFYGNTVLAQKPLLSAQAHIGRTIHQRHWFAFDFTYYRGGGAEIDGGAPSDYLSNVRVGGTYGFLLSRRQLIRVSYFEGVVSRTGTDIRTIGVAYQFVWPQGR